MPGKWYLVYSYSPTPGSGTREDREISLEAITEEAAEAEALEKWAELMVQVQAVEAAQKKWIHPPTNTLKDRPNNLRITRYLI